MKFQSTRIAQASFLCMACWASLPNIAHAQSTPVQPALVPGERLSDWLLRNAGPNADTTALHWLVQAERAPQAQLRQAAAQGLRQSPGITLPAEARNHLSDWLLALPLTGRLMVGIADARWLQSAPEQNPILQEGHSVVLLSPPSTVTLVSEAGQPCTAIHSFDKGLYVTIPFDVMLPKSTSGNGTVVWTPLTRDGGARLGGRFTLENLTRQRDYRALSWRSASPVGVRSAENTTYILTDPAPNALETLGSTTSTLGQQIGDIPASTWLLAGGAILASSLLDKRVDRWARNHQTGSANSLGTATNALPVALALGAGLLYTGIGGQPAASTAETALKAAAFTWGANLATRYVVGRARPSDEQGNSRFNGFNSGAVQSGFASNHVAVAFALVTPFAQQHDMPWLYAVAAASSFGRMQKREHWVSDTVAGAFMGYAIGSLLADQQRSQTGMRLSVTPRSVVAHWSFK